MQSVHSCGSAGSLTGDTAVDRSSRCFSASAQCLSPSTVTVTVQWPASQGGSLLQTARVIMGAKSQQKVPLWTQIVAFPPLRWADGPLREGERAANRKTMKVAAVWIQAVWWHCTPRARTAQPICSKVLHTVQENQRERRSESFTLEQCVTLCSISDAIVAAVRKPPRLCVWLFFRIECLFSLLSSCPYDG